MRGRLADARMERTLHDGDGLQIRAGSVSDFVYSGPETGPGQRATLRIPENSGAARGTRVFRLTD